MTLLLVSLAILLAGGMGALAARGSRLATVLGASAALAGGLLGVGAALWALVWRTDATLAVGWGGYGSFSVGIDPLSAWFLLPVFAIPAVAAVYGSESMASLRKPLGVHWFFYDTLAASMAGVVIARDALSFLVAWEAMALTSFFLVASEHEKASAREAGWIYLVATHLGTAFLLPFFLILGSRAGSGGFAAMAGGGAALPAGMAALLFVFALVGFGTKAGFMPLHVWLPEAYPAAPSHVSAVLSGAVSKLGIYGLLRALGFLGAPAHWWGWALVAIGVSSGVLGVLFALAQHDLKRLLAYSSVENVGLIALGLGLGLVGTTTHQPGLAALGFTAALLHVLNHSIFKGLLFLSAGAVLHCAGTMEIDRLGGLLKKMPRTGLAFLVGAVAICGLPPLNGFVGEFLLYAGAFGSSRVRDVGAALSCLSAIGGLALIGGLAAATFTKAFGAVFLGEARDSTVGAGRDPGARMKGAMAVLAVLCVAIGLAAPWVAPLALEAMPAVISPQQAREAFAEPREWLFGVTVGSVALWGLILGLALLRRALLSGRVIGEAGTWDCGYARPTARMQYTASSYADPLVRVFLPFLGTRQKLEAPRGLFPRAASMATETPDLGRERVFAPIFALARDTLGRLRVLQQGGMHLYVLYIGLTLIALLVWKL